MSWPDDDIPVLVKGERPTLIEAEKGNTLIDALNILRNITIEKGADDEVQYSGSGVKVIYKAGVSSDFNGDFSMIDANDVTSQITVTLVEGEITEIALTTSEWVEKTITICEEGSEVAVTFLVKS